MSLKSQGPRPLIDPFGRVIDYVRLSVTDRCNLRCTYCMSERMQFLPRKDLLTLEEMDRLASVFVTRGVTHLRLTGGEPLMRRGVMDLFKSLSRHLRSGRLKELTLTTNGVRLAEFAEVTRRHHLLARSGLQGLAAEQSWRNFQSCLAACRAAWYRYRKHVAAHGCKRGLVRTNSA